MASILKTGSSFFPFARWWRHFLRRSRDERLTIMFIPHAGSNGLSFHINYLHLYYFLTLILIYIALSFVTYIQNKSVSAREKVLRLSQIQDDKIINGYQKQYQRIGASVYNIQSYTEEMYELLGHTEDRSHQNIVLLFGEPAGHWFGNLFQTREIVLQELKYKLIGAQFVIGMAKEFLRDYPHFNPDNISLYPVDGYLVRGFDLSIPHAGLDIAAPQNTPIYAAAAGKVTRAEWIGGYGLSVELLHRNGTRTFYGHNTRNLVRPGDWVDKGDVIGLVGSTGMSTGNHVHFEVRYRDTKVDPLPYVKFFVKPYRMNPLFFNIENIR